MATYSGKFIEEGVRAPRFLSHMESEFPANYPEIRRRICREEEAIFGGADRGGVEAGRAGGYRWGS